MDPLAEDYVGWSGYNYVMGNPIRLVDPDGMRVEAPIFGTNGELLGTDAQGWEGEAIVMNKEDFEQGMNHEDALSAGTELGSYTEGIRISEEDWNTVEANGGEKMHPYVTNNSDETVFFKPEGSQFGLDNAGAYPIAANTDLYVPVDGVAAPHVKEKEMFKVIDGKRVTVTNNDVTTSWNLIQQFRGGWLDKSWVKENNQTVEFYNNSPAPPCCGSTQSGNHKQEQKSYQKTVKARDTSWNALYSKSIKK